MESVVQTPATHPFKALSIDIGMIHGTIYVVLVDWFTGWLMVQRLTKVDTRAVIKILNGFSTLASLSDYILMAVHSSELSISRGALPKTLSMNSPARITIRPMA